MHNVADREKINMPYKPYKLTGNGYMQIWGTQRPFTDCHIIKYKSCGGARGASISAEADAI